MTERKANASVTATAVMSENGGCGWFGGGTEDEDPEHEDELAEAEGKSQRWMVWEWSGVRIEAKLPMK
jgi:hypothetical protein